MSDGIKTRDGREVKIIAVNQPLIAGRSIVAIHRVNESEWGVNSWYANGKFFKSEDFSREDELDLILPDNWVYDE